jgi:hypothetical protein
MVTSECFLPRLLPPGSILREAFLLLTSLISGFPDRIFGTLAPPSSRLPLAYWVPLVPVAPHPPQTPPKTTPKLLIDRKQ